MRSGALPQRTTPLPVRQPPKDGIMNGIVMIGFLGTMIYVVLCDRSDHVKNKENLDKRCYGCNAYQERTYGTGYCSEWDTIVDIEDICIEIKEKLQTREIHAAAQHQ